jgi:hypothetical protein
VVCFFAPHGGALDLSVRQFCGASAAGAYVDLMVAVPLRFRPQQEDVSWVTVTEKRKERTKP